MTESTVVFTKEANSVTAGKEIGARLRAGLSNHTPDAVILFASSQHDYVQLLQAVQDSCSTRVLVGCSSAGEFASGDRGEGSASAVGIRSDVMRFTAGLGRNLRGDRQAAADEIASSFQGLTTHQYAHRAALVLADALAGYTDDFIEQLSVATLGNYRFFGGGAGDDARFAKTHVFCGNEAFTDAAVALEILSTKPIGVGVSHGWEPAGEPLRVTEAEGSTVISLNATPAVEIFEEHAKNTGQQFNRNDPVPFFLHNVLGIDTGSGYKLRVPLAILDNGAIGCASDVPAGATAYIMKTTTKSAADAAMRAVKAAVGDMNGTEPKVALFFDCVATRLRMGGEFGMEMDALQRALGNVSYAGCNTYGQIARSEGQFSGFHNCTATVALLPE
jgi:hypothetical protein